MSKNKTKKVRNMGFHLLEKEFVITFADVNGNY